MKHFALYFLLLFVVASCNPCKRLARLCPPSDSISYVETIDTIIVTVPETTTDVEFSLGDIGLTEENEDQIVQISVRDSIVYVSATCKQQEAEIYALRKKLASQKTIIERVEIPKYITKTSKYHATAGIIAPLLLLALAGAIYLLFKR